MKRTGGRPGGRMVAEIAMRGSTLAGLGSGWTVKFQRPTAEEGLAVGTALIVHGFAVGETQAGERGEFSGLIDALGAGGLPIDLLQGNEVGGRGGDDAGEAGGARAAVHAFAVMDIVSEDAQGARSRGRGGVGRSGQNGKEEQ